MRYYFFLFYLSYFKAMINVYWTILKQFSLQGHRIDISFLYTLHGLNDGNKIERIVQKLQ